MLTNSIALVILLALSAFFSASEVAFLSLTDAKVDTMVKKGVPRATRIRKLKQNPRRLLVTILIGNNIVNIAAASLATVVATAYFASGAIGIATGVMTMLVLIFGEIVPKSYATNHHKRFALFSEPFLRILQWVFFPLIILFEGLTTLFAGKHMPEKISEEELKAMAKAGAKQGTIEKEERVMLERLFEFNDITAEDIMTPRVQMQYLEQSISVEAAAKHIASHPHTRFPVVQDSPDTLVGFVHSRDVLLAYISETEHTSIESIVRPILRVPKQLPLDDLLKEFQKAQVHMAIVLDEYGGTEGVVTLEDVLEELVGEIVDEHDIEDNIMKRIDKHTILVAGDEDVRDVNDFLNCSIVGDPFDTIAEVVLDALGKIPRKNMSVTLGNTTCTIVSVKNRIITKVKVVKHDPSQ
jgi:putative hemolysin